jgi:hypothetical protein
MPVVPYRYYGKNAAVLAVRHQREMGYLPNFDFSGWANLAKLSGTSGAYPRIRGGARYETGTKHNRGLCRKRSLKHV